ncbi:MAG: long-chain fatty acid--CoA ligase [bacterium]|nr:MAG: long-chain fatty acid--CoA ligase [bacterium]
MSYENLALMIKTVSEKFPEKAAYMSKKEGTYQSTTFREVQNQIQYLSAALMDLGVEKDEKVLLLSENRMEWAISDYAILTCGAVTVPIYPTLLPKHIEFIINNSEGKVVIVSQDFQLEKILEIKKNLPRLKHIILMEGIAPEGVLGWRDFVEKGKIIYEKNPNLITKSLKAIKGDDLASIIYTSGTTGVPKGVMLTHHNFLSNIEAGLDALKVDEKDLFLSFLPLSHVFERMAGHFLASHVGATIAYAENIETVAQNLQEVHPTVMTSVPRFFEKVYARVLDSLEEGSAAKKKIFLWAIEVGKKSNLYHQKGLPLKGMLKSKYKIANKLVYSKLRERVGGNIRLFASGGAPLGREIAEFFNAAGLRLLEGYGLTETSPVITVNRENNFKFGTPGQAVINVEVAIAEDGEILTRGPHVMKGYYKNEEETREAIDEEKWFHTGDIGYLDKDGFLYITDRKKNIIVTSGGKNIAPQPIENLLITSKYIDQALVLGDKRKYCTAIIVPSIENLRNFAKKSSLEISKDDELLQNQAIKALIRSEIDRVSVDLASYETIKKFMLLKDPFTIESGELTPTLKIKRNVVEQKYQTKIDAMYAEDESMTE